MFPQKNLQEIHQILSSDIRVSKPAAVDDQVWELDIQHNRPLSLSTTYGLRAKRMLIFPEFSSAGETISGLEQYNTFPQLIFQSANICEVVFKPFSSIDANLKVWVPSSQIIAGQITCANHSEATKRLTLDWLVQLDPLPGGQIMTSSQMGMNLILQGQTGNLQPVFYLTGGPEETASVFPGLSIKMLLTPGASRQVTWVLASLPSAEASFQHARHFSSHQLDVEQFKIEMLNKRDRIIFEGHYEGLTGLCNQSQNRAYQMIMPAVGQFRHPTYVQERDADHGCHPREEMLEISPEWSGQTLQDIWMLAKNLLPGRPEIIKGLIQNILDSQEEDGWIDYRTSVNHRHTGHLAPPMLATLVCELNTCLEDSTWLEEIYPHLIAFFKRWFISGTDHLPEWTHPIQTGLLDSGRIPEDQLFDLWIKFKTSLNPFLLSMFYKETRSLIQIARDVKHGEDLAWLDQIRNLLEQTVNELWNEKIGKYEYRGFLPEANSKGRILCKFKQSGSFNPSRKLASPGRIFVRLDWAARKAADFCFTLIGTGEKGPQEILVSHKDFQWIGSSGIYIPSQPFFTLDSVEVANWKKGVLGEIGQADLTRADILSLLPLWAGIPSTEQADKLLAGIDIDDYVSEDGITLYPRQEGKSSPRIPNFLAAFLIEGLIQYKRVDLAQRFFSCHFAQPKSNAPGITHPMHLASLTNLIPVTLCLAILGIKKLSSQEIIFTHFNINPQPVTVQYNQTRMILTKEYIEITNASGNTIHLDKPGPHRIILK